MRKPCKINVKIAAGIVVAFSLLILTFWVQAANGVNKSFVSSLTVTDTVPQKSVKDTSLAAQKKSGFTDSTRKNSAKDSVVRVDTDRKSTRLNSSHGMSSRMPSSA